LHCATLSLSKKKLVPTMTRPKLVVLTMLTMIAFAGNSLLCRIALRQSGIDAASFTSIRLVSGALVLVVLARLLRPSAGGSGNWPSALALFAYAACFSFAYVSLTAGTGALLLFGAVQATMIGYGLFKGERLRGWQVVGLVLALGGLVGLVLPGVSAPPLAGALLMVVAGIAWGVYSLSGKRAGDPIKVTAGNFARAMLFAAALSAIMIDRASVDAPGIAYAIASGAIASGVGYAIWYTVLPSLRATSAATLQLSVPVIAAVGGILFLGESSSLRLILAGTAILGGVALVVQVKR
jgi:drug/metabolite transporter (DMT)-like permease